MKKMIIIWVFLAVGLVGTLTFIGLQFQEDIKAYRGYEKDIIESAQIYMEINKPTLDVGESLQININKLIKEKFLNTKEVGEDICDGYVIITKKYDKIDYSSYIKCEEYTTDGYKNS